MANLKIFVTDYTQFPEKILIQDRRSQAAETGKCPTCSKIGLIENRDGNVSYFHRLGYEFIPGEQYPAIRDETCNLPTKKEVQVLYGMGGYMCSHPSRDKEPVAPDVEVCGDCAADVRDGADIIRLMLDRATGEWVPKQ